MSTRYKRTNWVRRLEDFSAGCSSGLKLGQCLIAGILAIFSGISRLLPVTRWLSVTLSPDVPVSATGASSLKSPASFWRGVVFVALIAGSILPAISFAVSIQGTKFNDLTGDGEQNNYLDDNGNCVLEPGLPDETIYIEDLTKSETFPVETGTDGNFYFESNEEFFTLWIQPPPSNWEQTIPVRRTFNYDGNKVYFGITDTTTPSASTCTQGPQLKSTPEVTLETQKIAFENEAVSFDGDFSDADVDDTHSFLWEFSDDGSTANTKDATHTFTQPGEYTATFVVTDSNNEVGQSTITVKVFPKSTTTLDGLPISEYNSVSVSEYFYYSPTGQKITFKRVADYLFVMSKPDKLVSLFSDNIISTENNPLGIGNVYKFSDNSQNAITQFSQNTNVEYVSPLLTTGNGDVLVITNQIVLKRPATIKDSDFIQTVLNVGGLEHVRKLRLSEDEHIFKVTSAQGAEVFTKSQELHDQMGSQLKWAEPDFLVQIETHHIPDDLLYSDQWHLPKIEAPAAWDIATGGGVIIAINDSGVDLSHPDLDIWENPIEKYGEPEVDDDNNGYTDDIKGWDFSDNDNDPSPANSNDNHGTAVAGVAAAIGNNTIGVSGSARNAKILPIKIFSNGIATTCTRLGESLRYEAKYAHVANHSWGVENGGKYCPTQVESAIDDAVTGNISGGAMRGILVYL